MVLGTTRSEEQTDLATVAEERYILNSRSHSVVRNLVLEWSVGAAVGYSSIELLAWFEEVDDLCVERLWTSMIAFPTRSSSVKRSQSIT